MSPSSTPISTATSSTSATGCSPARKRGGGTGPGTRSISAITAGRRSWTIRRCPHVATLTSSAASSMSDSASPTREAIVRRNVIGRARGRLRLPDQYLLAGYPRATRSMRRRRPRRRSTPCFCSRSTLDEGITIYRCAVRLLPDQAAQEHLRGYRGRQSLRRGGRGAARGGRGRGLSPARARGPGPAGPAGTPKSREHQAMAGRAIDVPGPDPGPSGQASRSDGIRAGDAVPP